MNNKKDVWEIVKTARNKNRPNTRYYIENIFDEFIELHGDRNFRDDKAIIGAIASINNINVTVIGVNKGKNVNENIDSNFGMVNPEGYRKALRLMKQAEKFKRPIVCFVDTPGAFCGMDAEKRGQGYAIAKNLFEMSKLKTPIITIITGEGGSGGALALSVSDKVYMLENSIYSILSPEGFASILWKDSAKAKEAAEVMKLTGSDLQKMGVINGIIKEGNNNTDICNNIKEVIIKKLEELLFIDKVELVNNRYKKFRNM